MSRLFKVVSIMILIFLATGALFAQSSHLKPAWPAYVFSAALGFGSGQFYLGQDGAPFLVGDILGLGGVIGGYVVILSAIFPYLYDGGSSYPSSALPTIETGTDIVIVGLIVYMISRVWEFVDVFDAVDRAREAGKVAEIVPVVDVRRTSFEVGVSMKL